MRTLILIFIATIILSCGTDKKNETVEKIDTIYMNRGNAIAKISFETISGELKKSLENGDIEHALRYCNENAYPITDSLANANEVAIKRVSNKNRNPKNKADKMEEFLMKGFGIDLSEGNDLTPKLILKDDSVIFYKPIITQAFCLNCHGEPGKEITFRNDSIIQTLYPRDKAVGYKANELRGLWRIGFKKN